LRTGDLDLLALTMQDSLHQPYRIPLIPGAADAISAAKNAGAVVVVLSGAGPSLLAILRKFSDPQNVAAPMVEAFKRAGLSARVFTPLISEEGASVTLC
jgi:homoserine kinase